MIAVGEFVHHTALRLRNKLALVHENTRWSYHDLELRTAQLSHHLASSGVAPGDRVGILGAPSAAWVLLFLALQRVGAVAVGLNYRETSDRLIAMAESVGVREIFADHARAETLGSLGADIRISPLDLEALPGGTGPVDDVAGPSPCGPDHGGVILFTGGTTGVSKGVMLSPSNLFWNILNEVHATRMNEWDVTIIATALHHSAALNTWLLPHLFLGGTAVILSEFTPDGWLAAALEEEATNGFTPPTMARQILKHPAAARTSLSRFKRWYSGAGILPEHERAAMRDFVPGVEIFYQYGLTEAGPIVTCLQPEDYSAAPNSIGRATPHCQVQVLREDRTEAAPGEVGELAVKGPAVMKEYFNRPDETAKTFHGEWLLTGDLVTMDERGFVTFQDRSKDMIKTGGLNVYSQEVEAALADHPAVREVAVVGLPDDYWGERVTAVVTLHDGVSTDEQSLIRFARERLGGYQTPKEILFRPIEALPRNYLGKILKRELRDALEKATES